MRFATDFQDAFAGVRHSGNTAGVGRRLLLAFAIVFGCLTTAVAADTNNSPTIYFGQDVSPYLPFGPNQVPRPSALPKSDAAATAFLSQLVGVATETFESFDPGSVPTQLSFGTNLVAVTGDQSIVEVADLASTFNGEFPISGARGLQLVGNSGSGFFGLDFSSPQAAFGFYATDIELNGLNVTLIDAGGTNRVLTVPVTVPQGSAGALFWGVIDSEHPFVRVELTRTGGLEDGFMFDNLTVATPAQVLGGNNPTNSPPTISTIADISIPENTSTPAVSFQVGDAETPASKLVVTAASSNPALLPNDPTRNLVLSGTGADRTVTLIPATNQVGIATCTLTVTDEGGLSASRSFVLTVTPVARPLTVSIVSPPDRSVYCPGSDIVIAAAVQGGLAVGRVDFFAGTTRLGSVTNSPFQFVLEKGNIVPGDYTLTAVVTDVAGHIARSDPIRIAVSESCGDVAIVRNTTDPEIEQLVNYLFEIGLSAQVFEEQGLTFGMLQQYRTIVWDQFEVPGPTLTDADVALLAQAQTNGAALYLIGQNLASAGANLSPPMQAIWQNLSHLSATNAAGCDGVVHLQSSIDVNPVLGGRFGQVTDFGFEPEAEPGRLTGSDAEVLGRCGSSDVLVAFPGFEAVDTGQTRVFTQNLRVFSGTNAASIASRKTLFENVLCWLHGCECSTFDVVLEAIGSAPEVNLGQSLTYTLLVSHSGECEATGAVVTDRIPSGLTYVNANSEQGAVEYDPATQTVTINLGHLAKASTTTIGIEVTAASPGPWTNWAAVRINGEQSTNNNSAVVLTLVGNAGSTMNLTKKEGQLQLQFTGAGTDTIVVQRSADLRTWEDWRTNLFGPAWSEPLVPDGPRRFFRTKE